MNIIVYIDLYFSINFFMDFIILVIVAKLTNNKTAFYRYLLGSGFGAILSCILLENGDFPVVVRIVLSYILGAVGMILITFPFENFRQVLYRLFYMYGVTVVFGGILSSIILNSSFGRYIRELFGIQGKQTVSITMLIVSVALILLCLPYLISHMTTFRKRLNNIFDVTIKLEQKTVTAKALLDTGNQLREPMTNKPVIIVEKSLLKQVMTRELLEYTTRIRIIPYRSIGKEHGTMYALVIDDLEVTINTEVHKHENVVACVYEGTLSSKKDYQLILHEELM